MEKRILEAIHIKKENPTLNKDFGRTYISKIWDNILMKEDIPKYLIKNNEKSIATLITESTITDEG